MPVLNGDKSHLKLSIDSILEQTFEDFEFIIVDDGSNAETKALLQAAAQKDRRIVIVTNEVNIGVGESLNIGLAKASGEYIARHDADDIAKPQRFLTQFTYMQANPNIDLCCSSVDMIDMEGRYIKKHPCSTDSKLLEAELLLNSRLCHPSLMIKTDLLKDVSGYPVTKNAQDYLLFLKLLGHNKTFGGIDECLVDYRINTQSITRKSRGKQLGFAENGSFQHVSAKVGELDPQAFSRFWHFVASEGQTAVSLTDLFKMRKLLKLIKTDQHYRQAWGGPLRWVSRKSLDDKPSLTSLLGALYFRYVF